MTAWSRVSVKQRIKLRRAVAETYGNVCWRCHRLIDMALPGRHPDSFEVDHVIPRSRGGDPLALDNCRPAHKRCNSARGNRMVPPEPPLRTSEQW